MASVSLSPSRLFAGSIRKTAALILLSLILGWMIVSFLYLPVAATIHASFWSDGTLNLEAFTRLLESDRVHSAIFNTLLVSFFTVITVNVVGILQVLVLEVLDIRGTRILTAVYAIPLVFSSVAAVTGWNYVYGEHGFFTVLVRSVIPSLPENWFTGLWAVVIVHTFTMTGYHFLFLRTAIRRIDFSTVEAARSLGYSPIRAYLRVVLPVLRPTILAVTLMALIGSLGSFAAPAILGAGEFNMMAQLIQSMVGLQRLDMAAILALALAIVSAGLFVWMRRVEARGNFLSTSKSPAPITKLKLRGTQNLLWHVLAYLLAAINILPVLATVIFSLAPASNVSQGTIPHTLSMENYSRVLGTATILKPFVNSLILASIAVLATAIIATVCSGLIARRRGLGISVLEYSLFIPWVLPGMMIAVGLIAAYSSANVLVGQNVLVGSYWLLPIAYILMVLPIQVRMISTAWRAVDPSLDDAATSLGAPNWRRFAWITAPLIAPTVIQVAALAFNDVLGEYTLSVMLYNVENRPLGVALQSATNSNAPTDAADATVYIVCLLIVSLLMVLAADTLARRASSRTSRVPR